MIKTRIAKGETKIKPYYILFYILFFFVPYCIGYVSVLAWQAAEVAAESHTQAS